jgi:predicted cupin superfamily sugar epimerase
MDGRPLSPATHTAAEVARLLRLAPLDQEGGYFRRTAALHRLATDEIWCFHAGDALESLRLRPDGGGEWVKLGLDFAAGERAQDVVPAQTWQGTRLAPGGRWALVSCVVVPEFVWGEFELGERAALTTAWPAFAEAIEALTRTQPVTGAK